MFFSPYFKTVNVHIDRAEQPAVNHRWRHFFRMKRPAHRRQWDVQVLVSVDRYRSRKIWSPTVRQCTFYNGIWQERRRLRLDVDVPRRRALGGHTGRRPFTWCGVFESEMAISHCFCKLASAGGWWKLTDRLCLDSPLHAWRASKVNPWMFLQKHAVLAGTNSNLHESVFVEHPGKTQKRWQSIIALFSFHKGPPNFRRRRPPYKMNASWKARQSVRPAGNLAGNFVNTSACSLHRQGKVTRLIFTSVVEQAKTAILHRVVSSFLRTMSYLKSTVYHRDVRHESSALNHRRV